MSNRLYPPAYPNRCKSCNAEVFWIPSAAHGRLMILDFKPVSTGSILVRGDKAHVVSLDAIPEEGELRYVSHFATCPNADQHRKK